ncbi:MAG: hypothetical protein AAFX41_10485, partial [Bacteroidota bacterium]
MKAWYFAPEDRRLRFGDGRKVAPGVTHTIEGTPMLCEHGLHASQSILDALVHAPGPILCRVELAGEMCSGSNKVAAQSRTYLRVADTTNVLREFARAQALSVAHLWDMSDIVREYLETGDEAMRAAAGAAADAASAAAWDAASAA